ncbi:MAG: class I SAM-dependent methyltransferase [Ruminiclostridium sp.]|nr:class I SAM-dependent methyltransferase [Ruminiclostridium sp.]
MCGISNEWDNASKEWLESVKINQVRTNILMPETLKILGDIKGKRILDLGCGEGGYSRLFASKGAIVIGVDYSENLINEALKQNQTKEIEYYVRDASYLEGIEDREFDFVVSAMCLMAVENLESATKEAYRVIKPGGEFLISILHPCFGFEDYFFEGPYQEIESKYFGKPITFWHRTLSNTINCMLNVGFNLRLLYEPPFSSDNSQIPKILFLKFSK